MHLTISPSQYSSFSLIMFGLPSLADYFLHIDPVENGGLSEWIWHGVKLLYLYTLPYTYPFGLAAQTASV